MEKVVIIGSGITGLSAGIYAAREQLKPLIIEGENPGGQFATSSIVENWPGEIRMDGREFMARTRAQTEKNGARFLSETVKSVDFSGPALKVITQNQTIESEGIIIATGSNHKMLNCRGEKEFFGRGVAVCATCDGPLQKNKEVVIVGSGDTAIEYAYFLLGYASKINMVFIGSKPTSKDPLKDRVLNQEKIKLIPNHTVVEIKGDNEGVKEVVIEHEKTKKQKNLSCQGVFLAIGMTPNTEIFKNHVEMTENGYIKVNEWMETSVKGVFAAGDVLPNNYKQAISSAGQGCQAALSLSRWLRSKK